MADHDRIALVTGTSSGIGAAVATELVQGGWTVIGMSRRKADIANPRYRHIQLDVGALDGLRETAEREIAPTLAEKSWRRIGLVNNAALIGGMLPLEATEPEDVARVFAVNVVAPMFLMGFMVRHTSPALALRIVNVSTGAAVQPIPGLSDYGSSKAALRLAGMVLAAELGSSKHPGGARTNVSILSYAPGLVDTSMQTTARNHDGPWSDTFVNFHQQGLLQSAQGPAHEIVGFLAGDGAGLFSERRFGTS